MPPFTPIIFTCKDFGKSLRYLSNNQRDGKAFSITYPVTIGGLGSHLMFPITQSWWIFAQKNRSSAEQVLCCCL